MSCQSRPSIKAVHWGTKRFYWHVFFIESWRAVQSLIRRKFVQILVLKLLFFSLHLKKSQTKKLEHPQTAVPHNKLLLITFHSTRESPSLWALSVGQINKPNRHVCTCRRPTHVTVHFHSANTLNCFLVDLRSGCSQNRTPPEDFIFLWAASSCAKKRKDFLRLRIIRTDCALPWLLWVEKEKSVSWAALPLSVGLVFARW